MAQVSRARLLQLLRGTWKYRQSELVPGRLLGSWWHTLCRRSQQRLPWTRMLKLGDRWLPRPRVLHPYPAVRFAATHPR